MGATLPLLSALCALTARWSVASGSRRWFLVVANLGLLVWYLVDLESHLPYVASLQREQLVRLVCKEWSAVVVSCCCGCWAYPFHWGGEASLSRLCQGAARWHAGTATPANLQLNQLASANLACRRPAQWARLTWLIWWRQSR